MKPAKLKLLFSALIVILLYCYIVILPNEVRADNKCGVNVGPNYSQVNSVASLTKSGGWIVALGSPGNCTNFESLFGKGLNVVIRAYNGGQPFTIEQALGWVATLGKLDTKGQKVYFMPWNEPNHDNECGNRPCSVEEVTNYVSFLKQELDKAGLLNTKVVLLSPMIDKLGPRFEEFKNIYSLTNGSSINAYDQFVSGPCSGSPTQNNCQYDQIGIPSPYYAVEAGVAGTCNPPCYHDNEISQMLNTSWKKWGPEGDFKMFAVFSYDPHRSGWNLFSSPETRSFYQNNCSAGGLAGSNNNTEQFDEWFALNQAKLVSCGGCGWAPSASFCTAAGPGGATESPGEPMTPVANGDWFKIKKSFWIQGIGQDDPLPALPPEGTKAIIKVESNQTYIPEPYNNLKGLTGSLTGISQVLGEEEGASHGLENSGVWERLRLPSEIDVNPETKFLEEDKRKVKVYFDCVGKTEGTSDVKLDKNLARTKSVLEDLTQRLARTDSLKITNWGKEYKPDNTDCKENADGNEGERLLSNSTGQVQILGFDFSGLLGGIGGWLGDAFCYVSRLCGRNVEFTIAVQPKIVPDETTAAVPELSYSTAQIKKPDGSIEQSEGGIFRIFFPAGMETIGKTEEKLSQGELIHGKGIQDYSSPDWTILPQGDTVLGESTLGEKDSHILENVPADDYGLDGTKASYDFTQKALTPP